MYFLISLYVYYIIGMCAFVAHCSIPKNVDSLDYPSETTMYEQLSLTYNDLKNSITFPLPNLARNLKREFKINESVFAWGNYVKHRFELESVDNTLNTTATKYRLLPSNETIFIIRDYQNKTIGYLRLNGKPSFFSYIESVTLYNESGTSLLESNYCSFILQNKFVDGFGIHDQKNRTTVTQGYQIVVSSFSVEYRINFFNIQRLVDSTPLNLFLSQLQLLSSGSFINTGAPSIKSHGDIHIDDLQAFLDAPYDDTHDEVMSNNMGEPDDEDFLIAEAWIELKETLESTTPRIVLDTVERKAIASTLSERFDDENGNVDPQEILTAIDELSDEQKNLILDIISPVIGGTEIDNNTDVQSLTEIER